MSRAARYLFNTLTAVSLIVCAGASVLRVRGARTADYVEVGYWNRHPHPRYANLGIGTATRLLVLHHDGRLAAGLYTGGCIDGSSGRIRRGPGDHGEHVLWTQPASAVEITAAERLIASAQAWPDPRAQRGSVFLRDHWLILATAALPATRLLRRLRRRAPTAQANTCSICGYDLRATPNRCPECGTIAGCT
jgi:hypothetical protein